MKSLEDYVENGSGIEKRRRYDLEGQRIAHKRLVKKAYVWPTNGFFENSSVVAETKESIVVNPEDEMSLMS